MTHASPSSAAQSPSSPSSWGLELPERQTLANDKTVAAAWKSRKYDVAVRLLSEGLGSEPQSVDARQNYRALLSELRSRVITLEIEGAANPNRTAQVQDVARRFFTEMDHGTHHMAWMRCLVEQQMRGNLSEVMAQMHAQLEAKKSSHHGSRRADIALANLHGAIGMSFDPTHHTNLPYPLARMMDQEGNEVMRIIRMGCPVMALEEDATRYTVTPEFRAHIMECQARGEVHLYCNHLPSLTPDELTELATQIETQAAAQAASPEAAAQSTSPSWWAGLLRAASSLAQIAGSTAAAIVPKKVADTAASLAGAASSAIGVAGAYAASLKRRAMNSERSVERICYSNALQRFAASHPGAFKILQLSPDLAAVAAPQGRPSDAIQHLLQVLLNENNELVEEWVDRQTLELLSARAQQLGAEFFPDNSWPANGSEKESFAPAALLLMALFKDTLRAKISPRWCNSTCKDGIDRGGVFNAIDLLLQLDRQQDFNDPEQRAQWLASLHASAWEVKKQAILRNRHAPLQQLVAHLEQMDPQRRQALLAPLSEQRELRAEFIEGDVPPEAQGWKRALSWGSLDEAGCSSGSPSSGGSGSSSTPSPTESPSLGSEAE